MVGLDPESDVDAEEDEVDDEEEPGEDGEHEVHLAWGALTQAHSSFAKSKIVTLWFSCDVLGTELTTETYCPVSQNTRRYIIPHSPWSFVYLRYYST